MMRYINVSLLLGMGLLCSCGVGKMDSSVKKKNKNSLAFNTTFLPTKLEETSGLQYLEGNFYTFNDSGGKPEIYRLDANHPKKIVQTIRLKNAKNVDWESIAENEDYIFIGDFGNNKGNRKDLTIYYIQKSKIDFSQKEQEIEAESFSFFFPEQDDYSKQNRAHDFDVEAMAWYNGKLHLFTKEWKSLETHHYTLMLAEGIQPAWLVESYATHFLVTGADIKREKDGARLALLGYTKEGKVYFLQSKIPYGQDNMLSHPKRLTALGLASKVGQAEGITIKDKDTICISAEAFSMKLLSRKQNITCFKQK